MSAEGHATLLDRMAAAAEAERDSKGHDARSRGFCSPESVANTRAHAERLRDPYDTRHGHGPACFETSAQDLGSPPITIKVCGWPNHPERMPE